METVVKLDSKKRLTLPQGKPGSHLAITVNGDGTFTLTPVKADAQEPFPRGSLKAAAERLNKQWAGVDPMDLVR
jgi:hypothetical protein